ncbi:hypothetical protein IEQ34_016405 [Dendrobium chrysotoxum]|uniref:Late embryogenesis abundant protein LEA-2 subgroup domain-containing protein n=1 Tax=Dendrobium chrysotoxum TaxID=161865 RepID=A0AAV7GDF3_DENCH|nr:hypothetical protein IEQ34_016405 [Dendrobium chrysotoxum]
METKKSLKICCAVTAILLLLLVITLLILYFTVLKPKKPVVVATPVGLDHIDFSLRPNVSLTLSIRMNISIKNPNYAGFKYKNSSASIFYGGDFVGETPIEAGIIHARSIKNISTVVNIIANKVIGNPKFFPDVFKGSLNMNSEMGMEGKVILLGIFKLHARTYSTCDITIFVWQGNSTANCNSKIEL